MRNRLLLTLAATLLLPAAGAAHPDPGDADVLAVRYAFVVGGRNGETAPPAAGVLSERDLAKFLSGWNPDRDFEEVRKLFALNDLGEVARQAVLLPASGGALSGRFSYRDAALTLRLRVEPGSEGVRVGAEVEREGELLSAPLAQIGWGERAILSSATDEPELPFVFIVVEIERTARERVTEQGLPTAWSGRAQRVDGVVVLPPKVLEKTQPQYPEAARKERIEGVVVLEALIDEQGVVRDLRALSDPSRDLTEAAMAAVRTWRFAPATLGEEPIAVVYALTVNFRLQKEPLAEKP